MLRRSPDSGSCAGCCGVTSPPASSDATLVGAARSARASITTPRSTASGATRSRSRCARAFSSGCDAWRRSTAERPMRSIGALCGLLILVRHTNILIPAVLRRRRRAPHAPHCPSWRSARRRGWSCSAAVALSPRDRPLADQLVRSAWDSRSPSPHIAGRAGQPAKGLFFWAPLLLAAVAGLAVAAGGAAALALPAARARWPRHLHDRELVGLAVRRQLRPSRVRRFLSALRARPRRRVLAGRGDAAARVACRRSARDAAVRAVALPDAAGTWHGVLPMSDITWPQYRCRLSAGMVVTRRVAVLSRPRWPRCGTCAIRLAYRSDHRSAAAGNESPTARSPLVWRTCVVLRPCRCRRRAHPRLHDVRRTEPGGDRPMMVTFTIDDRRAGARPAHRRRLARGGLDASRARADRRVRRVDIRTNITRMDNHGVRIGQPCCYSYPLRSGHLCLE